MLRVENLSAGYGEAEVLQQGSLRVGAGEVVTLCGRNGAGKTTLLRCIMGLHQQQRGNWVGRPGQREIVEFDGVDLTAMPVHKRALRGIGWVPDDRGIYASLSVYENLALPLRISRHAWSMERVFRAFPVLAARRNSAASTLSGGEQRILALARVLRTGSKLLLCDEPTEGLSPMLVAQIGQILRDAKARGVTVLLVEQNLRFATTVADRHYMLAEGRVVDALDNSEVRARVHELLQYLGI
jgi:branched-chain amino acid transport system ATP-binding protein